MMDKFTETKELSHCKAPYFAIRSKDGIWSVGRGNCNKWSCPQCGLTVAKEHYWRIVRGSEDIAAQDERNLYFLTVTCRGKELSYEDSMLGYMTWTNKLFTALRTDSKRHDEFWAYVQVTEKQKRGHPHSHVITTFSPRDKILVKDKRGREHFESAWLQERLISAGLGQQYDLTLVKNPSAVGRYVAKYMFKPTMFDNIFPANWKRVRYSQNWPKYEVKTDSEVMVLVTDSDWLQLAKLAVAIQVKSHEDFQYAKFALSGRDVIIVNKS